MCVDLGSRRLIAFLPLAICWSVWRVRTAAIFNGVPPTAARAIGYVQELLHDVSMVQPFLINSSTYMLLDGFAGLRVAYMRRHIQILVWEKPCSYKLNIDGSSIGTGEAGGGAVLRDYNGDVIFAASIFFGKATSVYAEVLALIHGLKLCEERGLQGFQVDTDSLLLVNMIHGVVSIPWRYRVHLQHILALLRSTNSTLHHRFREVNSVADALARLASSTRSSDTFQPHTLPLKIQGLARLDQVGLPYVRTKSK